MFNSIFVNGSLTAGTVLLTLGMALLLGLIGAFYYTKKNTATKKRNEYSGSTNNEKTGINTWFTPVFILF